MQVCLFDIDGTLLNTGGAGQAAMIAALEAEFGITAAARGISTAGRTDRAITRDLFEFYGIGHEQQALDRFLAAYLVELSRSLEQREGCVLPGIPSLLQSLSGLENVELGLLTGNFREGAHRKLKFYGLQHYFEFGGFGDSHLERDDVAREALREAQSRVSGSLSIERVWVVGDTPADVRCGHAIGAQVVAVGTGHYSIADLQAAEPDHLLADFSDPARLLDLLQ